MAEPRIIKKYPNRRLYDTELSRYITLSDIRGLVLRAAEFQVIDAHTKEDITRNILLQIILEQESGGEPLFTTQVLEQMIRFYGDTVQGLFTRYLDQTLALFKDQQKHIQEQMRGSLGPNPLDVVAETTQRNLELWMDIQGRFFKAAGLSREGRDGPDSEHTKDAEDTKSTKDDEG